MCLDLHCIFLHKQTVPLLPRTRNGAYVAYNFALRGQGAAQCIEDAAALSALFARLKYKSQIPDLLTVYEGLRKPRALELQRRSLHMRVIYGMYDGDEQVKRDRHLTQSEPFEGYPVAWMDPTFQKWMYTYDAAAEAERAWDQYVRSTKG